MYICGLHGFRSLDSINSPDRACATQLSSFEERARGTRPGKVRQPYFIAAQITTTMEVSQKIGVLSMGVLMIRFIVYWGLYQGPSFLETPISL